jgi:carbonyl reductase 1
MTYYVYLLSLSFVFLILIDAAMSFSAAAASASESSLPPPALTTGRVALVTGANKGVGKEICRLLAKDPTIGATVMVCRSLERGQKARQELLADGCQNLYCCEYDLSKPESATSVRDYVETHPHLQGRNIDILINNAAICFNDPTLYGAVEYTPFDAQAEITIRTNFFGTWRLTQALLPLMLLNKNNKEPLADDNNKESPSTSTSTFTPRLINIASNAGRLAILKSDKLKQKFTSEELTMDELEDLTNAFVQAVQVGNNNHAKDGWPNTCYGLSKLATIAMTRVLSRLYTGTTSRPRMMCNTVDPGYCATDQNNHQGNRPAARGAVTPFLLATLPDEEAKKYTGLHWFDESPIQW